MNNNLGKISFRVIKSQETDQVFDFLMEHYYPEEPLGSSEPKMIPNEMNRHHLLECIEHGTSMLMMEETSDGKNKLIGVITGIVNGSDYVQGYYADYEKLGKTKYGQISKIMADGNKNADMLKRYSVQEIFYIFSLSIHRQYRGYKLGSLMIRELIGLAKNRGYSLASIDCSSFYSAQAIEALGWDLCSTIFYKDYLDENGKQIFVTPPPHVAFKVYALRL